MYLSRLILNSECREVRRDAHVPYEMHRTIMRAFPDRLEDSQERVLFRLEAEPADGGGLFLLVQSWTWPDWAALLETRQPDYLLPLALCPSRVDRNPAVMRFDPQFRTGQVLAFRLLANPTTKIDGKRRGRYTDGLQLEWLDRKAEGAGFRVVSAHISGKGMAFSRIPDEGKTHRARFFGVQFDGILQVTEPERLAETVRRGIGSGKGFGFGLLSLARVPG